MFVYVLQSLKSGRYYIGSTRDMEKRLQEHNGAEENPSRWTRGGGPWELVYSRGFSTSTQALRAEKFVKRMKSRKYVEQLIRGERKLDEFDNASTSS